MNDTDQSESPGTGGKLLSRDLSLLRGLSLDNRRNYILLCAASDAAGRFYRHTMTLGVDDAGVRRLAKKGLVACYKHRDEDVGYIPGGESHERYGYSPISTLPPSLPHMPSSSRLFLHRDHRLIYRGLSSLEIVVLHALINLSDSHGRGRLCHRTLLGIIGPCKRENDSRLKYEHLVGATAKLAEKGRLVIYNVACESYYAVLDAKQWAIHFIPGSKIPPPPGEKWDYSLDSSEGLEWHRRRKETRKKRAEKRAARGPVEKTKAGAAKRAVSGEASKEDLEYLFSKPPHKVYKQGKTSEVVFAAGVLTGKTECPDSELLEVLEEIIRRNLPVEIDWFAGTTHKSVMDACTEIRERLKAAMGAEPIRQKSSGRR